MTAVAGPTVGARVPAPDRFAEAADGIAIRFRETRAPNERALLFFEAPTLGRTESFQLMADELAVHGVTSYAVQSRTGHEQIDPTVRARDTLGFRRHADDFSRIVELGVSEHRNVPAAVMGSSFGGSVVMYRNAARQGRHLPVIPTNVVVLDRFLTFKDKLKIAGGLFSRRIADMEINSPMSRGVPITNNPRSIEQNYPDPRKLKVTAGLYGDVLKMNAVALLKGRRSETPMLVALAGDDRVSHNRVTRALLPLIARAEHRELLVVAAAAHDLSQAADKPQWVARIAEFAIARGRR